MTPAEHYRMYAAIAADTAAEATDPGSRATLLERAQTWRNLADKEEQSQPPQMPTQAQQAAQQQQQPQPDDEKDK